MKINILSFFFNVENFCFLFIHLIIFYGIDNLLLSFSKDLRIEIIQKIAFLSNVLINLYTFTKYLYTWQFSIWKHD